MGHPDPDLIAAGVGRLVPEQDQVEGAISLPLLRSFGEGRSGCLGVPIGSVGREQGGLVGTPTDRA